MAENLSVSQDGKKARRTGPGVGHNTSVRLATPANTNIESIQILSKELKSANAEADASAATAKKARDKADKIKARLEVESRKLGSPTTFETLVSQWYNPDNPIHLQAEKDREKIADSIDKAKKSGASKEELAPLISKLEETMLTPEVIENTEWGYNLTKNKSDLERLHNWARKTLDYKTAMFLKHGSVNHRDLAALFEDSVYTLVDDVLVCDRTGDKFYADILWTNQTKEEIVELRIRIFDPAHQGTGV